MEERQPLNTGALITALTAFCLWGILPVYWKFFGEVPAYEVLAHRILWSFFFMIALVLLTGKAKGLWSEIKTAAASRRRLLHLIAGSILISGNWLTYIWAVNHDRVVESGLGYYISPLLQVLMGVVVFRERLSLWQLLAVALAAVGVIYLTVNHGSFPVVAMILASTITVYGYCKKVAGFTAINGMTMETAVTAPAAAIFFIFLYADGQGYPVGLTPTFLLLIGAGAVTAVPLILFTHSLNRLPLSTLGIIQYIAPTLTVLLGVFVYKEVFSRAHLVSFSFIWSGLILFTAAKTPPMVKLEMLISKGLRRLD